MSDITTKISNTTNAYIGSAKQSVGSAIGNPTLAGKGAAQRAQAETSQKVTDAKVHSEGVGNTIHGNIQKAVGSLVGNPTLKAKGHANIVKGDVQKQY
jgi:uncharacterized protein YjbJ (UPF0337 family)